MKLQDILQGKGTEVYHIEPEQTLKIAVKTMVNCGCGALLVCKDSAPNKLVGIISERDILRAIAGGKEDLSQSTIAQVMTSNVFTATPGSSVDDAMGLMTEKRIRHLPIVENDNLVGIISIGDLVKSQHDHLSMENHYLKNYLHQS